MCAGDLLLKILFGVRTHKTKVVRHSFFGYLYEFKVVRSIRCYSYIFFIDGEFKLSIFLISCNILFKGNLIQKRLVF